MNRYRLRGVALVLMMALAMLPIGALAQEGAESPPCDFQQLEALQAALGSSREAAMTNPDDPAVEATYEAATATFHDYLASCFPPSGTVGADETRITTEALAEETCPAETTILYVNDSATGADDGMSWTDAYTDLRAALAAADSTTSAVEIWVVEGTYKPTAGTDRTATFQLKSCVTLYGGFDGTERSSKERNPNPSSNNTVLSGDIGTPVKWDNIYHVVTASGTGAGAVLDGFTVTDGDANGLSPNNTGGGGVYNEGGSPTLNNVLFSNNSASYDGGGGMYNVGGNPMLTNVTFDNNDAYRGGGLYNEGGNPTLTDVTFSGNTAGPPGGSGMYNEGGNPTLTNVTFIGNKGDESGGGMNNVSGNPTLINVTFSDNSADRGGGMYNGGGSPTLTNVFFSGNSAFYGGGGMSNGGNPTLTNVTFSNNSAMGGGGLYNEGGNPTLTNVTFSNNSSTGDFNGGGGMSNSSGSPTLTNVTFSNNSSTGDFNGGGGMFNSSGSPTIQNSILWGNAPDQILDDSDSSSAVAYSDIEGGWPGTGNINADPRFVDAGSGDLRLQFFSPAINVGNNDYLPADVTMDLAGNPRIVGGTVDMGAYEFPIVTDALYVPALVR